MSSWPVKCLYSSAEKANNIDVEKYNKVFFLFLELSTWLVGRVFAIGPGDLGSILGHVLPKTLKRVLDTSLLSTKQYKVRIKGKVEQSRERSNTLPYTSV